MSSITNSVQAASALESGSAESVEAAVAESGRGNSPFSISLLLDSLEKERAGLDSIEDALKALRISLSERRHAIGQQEEMLRDLADFLQQRS